MKFENKSKNIKFNHALINSLSKQFGVNPEIIKLIYTKGYTSKKDIVNFLQPQNFKWHNPYYLSGMDLAVKIVKDAVKNKKKVTILGDYDTDGICSTAILYKYFESENIVPSYFLPNRFVDGYGLTMDTIDKIQEEYNPDLIITVDCGISSYNEIEYAKSKGIEVLVTDHHEIPELKPDCVIVNPKIEDQKYPFRDLCGAGVALKLVQALKGFEFAKPLVSIAAIATVADIVALKDENRAIVYNGLKEYKQNLPIGIIKLLEKLKLNQLQSTDIAFKLAPKLNTAGRMGDANLAFRLFVEKNIQKINSHISELDLLNEQRVSDGTEIYEECLVMLNNVNVSSLGIIVLYKDEWNGGVLGIVCAKLVEKYHKPVCLISRVENEYKGSVRSVEGIDIYQQLSNVKDILIRFGGHNQAGGMSVTGDNLEEFKTRINENILNDYKQKYFIQTRYYDMDINRLDLNHAFVQQIQMLEPFGFGNEKPIFKLTFNNAKIDKLKNYANHLKIVINNLSLIGFNFTKYEQLLQTNSTKNLLLELNTNNQYNNKNVINGIIKNITFGKLNTNLKAEYITANKIKQLNLINEKTNVVFGNINSYNFTDKINAILDNSLFGTLIVTNNFDNYAKFINDYGDKIINYELGEILSATGENTILYAPNYNYQTNQFKNVIVLEPVLCDGFLNNYKNSNVYIYNDGEDSLKIIKSVETSREVFAIYHNSIINLSKNNIVASDEYSYYRKLIKLNPNYKKFKYEQFVFVTMVLNELGIIDIVELNGYKILVNSTIKSKLENSAIYNFIKLAE